MEIWVPMVAIFEQDHDLREILGELVQTTDFRVRTFSKESEFLEFLRSFHPYKIIIGIDAPFEDPMNFLRKIKNLHPRIPLILATSQAPDLFGGEILRTGQDAILPIPFALEELKKVLLSSVDRETDLEDFQIDKNN